MKKMSFRMKLQLILLATSGVSLAVLFLIASQSAKAFRAGKESQVKVAADALIDKIDRNLFERYGDVQAYALSEPARSGNLERITAFMNDMMPTYSPIYDLMIVTNAKGKVIAVSTVDKDNKPVKTESLLGTDYSHTAWFKAAINNEIKPGLSFVEDLHVDHDVARVLGSSGRVMNFSAPIRDKITGEVIGVWSNRMSWANVVEAISKEEAEKVKNDLIVASFPYIVDAKGLFLVHPQGTAFELQKSYVRDAKAPAVMELQASMPEFSGQVLEAASPSKGYSSYPGRGWTAMLQVPAQDAQTDHNRRMGLLAILLVLGVNVFGHVVIRRISRSFELAVGRMASESTKVKAAANEISTASQELSETTTEQAAAIEETAASMEEMTSMLGQTTQHASQCMTVAESGQQEALKGKQVINKMSVAMEEIQSANTKLDRLVGLIEDIKNKTRVINDIVFETRLLSFNASIEAARAGVHGKGFAVVAEEVGKLASMSGKAADEIHNLLDSSAQEVATVVKGTQERVNLGKSISQDCEVAFGSMGETMEKVSEAIRMINAAAKEQESGVKQTNRAMSEMDKVTQSNSKGAETLADQANKLYEGSASLDHEIQWIRDTIFGEESDEGKLAPAKKQVKLTPVEDRTVVSIEEKKISRSDDRWKSAS